MGTKLKIHVTVSTFSKMSMHDARLLTGIILLVSTSCGSATTAHVTEAHGSLAEAGRATPVLDADVKAVLDGMDADLQDHPGFKHFIWKHIAGSSKDLAFWRKFALHYYEHVRVFRLYLAGAMTVVPIEDFQITLSEILADEFGVRLHGEPDVDGHPALFRRFMLSLGLTEEDWEAVSTGKNLLPGIAHYKKVHYSLFQGGLSEEMVGAIIFGMERTTPHRHSAVLDGLNTFSQQTGHKVDVQFFSEHVAVDDYHNTALIKPLESWFRDPTKVQRMKEGAVRSFDARREFLDNLADEMGIPNPNRASQASSCLQDTTLPAAHVLPKDVQDALVVRFDWLDASRLVPHEQVLPELAQQLSSHLEAAVSTRGGFALPAITVDADTLTVIDGHHRLHTLTKLGHERVPCLLLNYKHSSLKLVASGGTGKQHLIHSALSGETRPPKSTFHSVTDTQGSEVPVEVLSPIVWVPGRT